jgi:threonine dehydrogenase-like Zn-dependent dehydrogenase
MKAIVYHAPRDFRVESVPDPKLGASTDAVVRTEIITHRMRLADGIRGYPIFGAHAEGVLKLVLQP